MSEQTLSQQKRKKLATQLGKARAEWDKPGLYIIDRDMTTYLDELVHVKHLLQYVKDNRNTLKSNVILDIGAGTTKAASQIKKSPLSKGLLVKATVLSLRPEIKDNLGKKHTHVTSVERLKGIEDNSVAAIISVFGISYSKVPNMAVSAIDRVLVPSGVVKANFVKHEFHQDDIVAPSSPDEFVEELKTKGYDVFVSDNPCTTTNVLVAVKAPVIISAKALFNKDLEEWWKWDH